MSASTVKQFFRIFKICFEYELILKYKIILHLDKSDNNAKVTVNAKIKVRKEIKIYLQTFNFILLHVIETSCLQLKAAIML